MADVGAGRTSELPMRLRLEGQQRQHVVDIAAHLVCPARPPGPHARRHVVDDGDLGAATAYAPGGRLGALRAGGDDGGGRWAGRGTSGLRRRMRLAIGWVNSGLSMMTMASGSAATAAAAVPWMRRR